MTKVDRRTLIGGLAAFGVMGSGRTAAGAEYRNERVIGPGFVTNGVNKWLLPNFGEIISSRAKKTPFPLSLICAIAYQESGYRWWNSKFRGNRTPAQVLRLLVLDDAAPRRSQKLTHDMESFRADRRYGHLTDSLVSVANKAREIADERDEDKFNDKLRYGYGLFQYDLQNIEKDSRFWTEPAPGSTVNDLGLWGDIGASTSRFISELTEKYDATRNIDRAVHDYNGGGPSAEIYLYNVGVYRHALLKGEV